MQSSVIRTAAVDLGGKKLMRWFAKKAAIVSVKSISMFWSGLFVLALLGFSPPAQAEEFSLVGKNYFATPGVAFPTTVVELPRGHQPSNGSLSALVEFVQAIDAEQPRLVEFKESANPHVVSANPHPHFDQAAFAALREFAKQVGIDKPDSARTPQVKVAEADNAVDALRELFQRGAQPSTPPRTAPPSQSRPPAPRPVINATFVGEKVCMGCHASHAAEFSKTMMGRIASTKKTMNCETCHGPGSAHVKAGGGRGVGGIISFRPNDQSRTSEENNAICLSCHERGDRTYWKGSVHEVRDVACTNCHTIMKNVSLKKQLKTAFEPETCFQCHKDRRAQVARSSHMPLREGKVSCTNCHNPHGSFTEALLRKNSINDTCYQCHAEKRGPFLFEHTPVRESCVNCHEPHGTLNEYSLKMSRQRLCAECHTIGHGLPSGPQAVQSIGRQCQNCHTAIHGTNSPSGALLQR